MKRKELLKHRRRCGCSLLREGANHSVFINQDKLKVSTVPRHAEVNDFLAQKICRDLEIDLP
jgi:mRNA interferase HicA